MDVPKPLKYIVQAWYDARKSNDPDGIARVYEESGVIVLPTGKVLRGRPAIKAHYTHTLRTRGQLDKLRFGPRQFFLSTSIAHMTRRAQGKNGERHSFVDIFTKQANGKFLFACSSWTILSQTKTKRRTK
jgi:uncharacterized protein (TIGR02246 family)